MSKHEWPKLEVTVRDPGGNVVQVYEQDPANDSRAGGFLRTVQTMLGNPGMSIAGVVVVDTQGGSLAYKALG
jgi:hypothetical protein